MSDVRIHLPQALPEAYKALRGIEAGLRDSGLEPSLIDLVKLRASQINQCAYCVDMHSRDARRLGESEQRLYLLSAWRETSLYSERERAALAWTEQLTQMPAAAPGDGFNRLRRVFSEPDALNLTLLIGMINLWNRLSVGLSLTAAIAA